MRNPVKLWLASLIFFVTVSCWGLYADKKVAYLSVEKEYSAQLIEAYKTLVYTSENGREVFIGRFKLADGFLADREIDGFFFQKFVRGGEKPLAAIIKMTPINFGQSSPLWIDQLRFWGFISIICFLFVFFIGIFSINFKEVKQQGFILKSK